MTKKQAVELLGKGVLPSYEVVYARHEHLRSQLAQSLGFMMFAWSPENCRKLNERRQQYQAATELLKLIAEFPEIAPQDS